MKFIDLTSSFLKKNDQFIDMVQAHMSIDIEIIIKTGGKTPVKTGQMKSQVRSFKPKNGSYRVEADAEYSAVQEAGQRAGSQPFRNYTTAGTGPGWFEDAITKVVDKKEAYVKEAARAVFL